MHYNTEDISQYGIKVGQKQVDLISFLTVCYFSNNLHIVTKHLCESHCTETWWKKL